LNLSHSHFFTLRKCLETDLVMSQVEKKAGLLRRTSSSKKPLKEKVVLMYDEIFAKEDPAKNNPRFWDELFLMKVQKAEMCADMSGKL
ncbi:Armadillo-like helical domain-containing protein 3, partial [Xenoophorus captivus]